MTLLSTDRRARILITDDNPANRILLARTLQAEYEVDTAENGQEAIDKLIERDYDLVLLDIMMPVLDGLSTLEYIREHVDLATLPVIIVSAINESAQVAAGIEMGANDYITKPIEHAIVKARVKTQITLKRLMDERQEAVNALQQANEMKVRMMQVASHDLKNPLNNLNMLMNVMGHEGNTDNKRWDRLKSIADTSLKTMLTIIDEYLSSANIMNDELSIELATYNAKELVETTVKQYSVMATEKNINVHVNVQDTLITADSERLLQVISNLVSNAIKYSPKNSDVLIQTSLHDGYWRLEVIDSGTGIPKAEREFLFQAFSKNEISTQPTAGESSTGLGLWIAAEMVRLQNGAIGMIPASTGGCNFWIEMPLAEDVALEFASAS